MIEVWVAQRYRASDVVDAVHLGDGNQGAEEKRSGHMKSSESEPMVR